MAKLSVTMKYLYVVVFQLVVAVLYMIYILQNWDILPLIDKRTLISFFIINLLFGIPRTFFITRLFLGVQCYEIETCILLGMMHLINRSESNSASNSDLQVVSLTNIVVLVILWANLISYALYVILSSILLYISLSYTLHSDPRIINAENMGLSPQELNRLKEIKYHSGDKSAPSQLPGKQTTLSINADQQAGLEKSSASLHRKLAEENQQNSCSICLCGFVENDELLQMPICNHQFHKECVKSWLNGKISCPYCRSDVRVALQQLEKMNQKLTFTEVMMDRLEPSIDSEDLYGSEIYAQIQNQQQANHPADQHAHQPAGQNPAHAQLVDAHI